MSVNWDLLNRADYEDFDKLKEMLVLYNTHKRNAARGDSTAHAILIDLTEAIYSGVLTEKQLEVVELYCMHSMTHEAIGTYLEISKQSVGERIHGAIKCIQKMLISGELFSEIPCQIALCASISEAPNGGVAS